MHSVRLDVALFLSFFLSFGLWEQGEPAPGLRRPARVGLIGLFTPLGFRGGITKVLVRWGPLLLLEVAAHSKLLLQDVCLLVLASGFASKSSVRLLSSRLLSVPD